MTADSTQAVLLGITAVVAVWVMTRQARDLRDLAREARQARDLADHLGDELRNARRIIDQMLGSVPDDETPRPWPGRPLGDD